MGADDGVVVGALEEVEVGLVLAPDGVLAGADAGGEAGVEEVADAGWSEVLGVVSFFSPALDAGTSLAEVGFILSE